MVAQANMTACGISGKVILFIASLARKLEPILDVKLMPQAHLSCIASMAMNLEKQFKMVDIKLTAVIKCLIFSWSLYAPNLPPD